MRICSGAVGSADEDRQATEHSAEEHCGQQDGDDRDDGCQGSGLDPVPCGRGQVEADECDDRTGDHGRHRHLDPADTDEVDDESDQCQSDAH